MTWLLIIIKALTMWGLIGGVIVISNTIHYLRTLAPANKVPLAFNNAPTALRLTLHLMPLMLLALISILGGVSNWLFNLGVLSLGYQTYSNVLNLALLNTATWAIALNGSECYLYMLCFSIFTLAALFGLLIFIL